MTITESAQQTRRVRRFYDDSVNEGEAITEAYVRLMVDDVDPRNPFSGHMWFHGDPATEQASGGDLYAAKREMLRKIAKAANLGEGMQLVEFGAGVGGAAVWLAEHTGATITGVSNSDSLSQRARALAARRVQSGHLAPGLTPFHTIGDEDYKTLSAWGDASVDAFLAMESPCHLPPEDLPDLFASAARIVKPGGKLVVQDWLQRPWGLAEYERSPMEIDALVLDVSQTYRLAQLGDLDHYSALIAAAGFKVETAEDIFLFQPYSSAEPPERWQNYDGPAHELAKAQWAAMNAARSAGVFTVGLITATRLD